MYSVLPYSKRSRHFLFGSVHLLSLLQNYRIHLNIFLFRCLFLSFIRSLAVFDSGSASSDSTTQKITFSHATGRKKPVFSLALFYFPKPTRFSMSTTRALLPRPVASYAPRVVVVVAVGRLSSLSSCTSRPRYWEVSTRVADSIERRESRRRRRRRRRRTCGRVGVAPASLK